MSTISLLTVTYRPDFERCILLCESVDRHVTGFVTHYLLVDDIDLPLFARFNGPHRTVLGSSQFLPRWLKQVPRFINPKNHRRYWYSFRSKPVSGWLVQQLLKISATRTIPETRCCILDSDTVFFRRLDLSPLQRPKQLPLLRVPSAISPERAPHHVRWVESSHRLLGLKKPSFPAQDFIGNVIIWDQATVLAMTNRIECVTSLEWELALCRAHDVSEYLLYGIFVENDESHRAEHVFTSESLCVTHWGAEALDAPAIDKMLSSADSRCVAFCAQSFSGTPVNIISSSVGKFSQVQ